MINASWKQRFIQYAHTHRNDQITTRSRGDFPKIVLGRKVLLRKTMNENLDWLRKIKGEVKFDELLSFHTSIRIGGPADVFIVPESVDDLVNIFRHAGRHQILILGEGTNLLVKDGGFRGIVVSLKDGFRSVKDIEVTQHPDKKNSVIIRAGAGVKLSYLAKHTARLGLTGLESLVGIPGSLGGALMMNAGAEGSEIGDYVHRVSRISKRGKLETFTRDDLEFQYRKTIYPRGSGVIVEGELELEKCDPVSIQKSIDRYMQKRSHTQPLNMPNSGSVFKNPEGDKAGRLIESVGMKGYSIGDAGISIKHANFLVNKGNALARDALQVLKTVEQEVKDKTGIRLEREIIIVGE